MGGSLKGHTQVVIAVGQTVCPWARGVREGTPQQPVATDSEVLRNKPKMRW